MIKHTLILLLTGFTLNYWILKKGIKPDRIILICTIIALTTLVICFPIHANAKSNFIHFQKGRKTLGDAIEFNKVIGIKIIDGINKNGFTIPPDKLDLLKTELRTAPLKPGIWKYKKSHKWILEFQNGTTDTLVTNGTLIGPVRQNYYESKENLIQKYLP